MTIEIPSGIPGRSDYDAVTGSELFASMEKFSGEFLAEHPVVQASYGWVADPLHQWSRQYEYPYVYKSILEELVKRPTADILDAGSGATFFPFLLREKMQRGSITCCDYDATLAPIFDMVNAERESDIRFSQADLRKLPFADGSFDIIYCVSVLEHTDQYEDIVREFHRVLRPQGVLVATFDIGLDGVSDISPAAARDLHVCIESNLGSSDLADGTIAVGPSAITSAGIGAERPELLPWRYPLLSFVKAVWKRKTLPTRIGKNLTVLCARYIKS